MSIKQKGPARFRLHPNQDAIWRKFTAINSEIIHQFDELHAYNRYWAKFASIYFVAYIEILTYIAYGLLFDKSESDFAKRSFFLYFTFELLGMLLLITHEASKIVYNNVQIYKTNRAFCYTFGRVAKPKTVYLLKVCNYVFCSIFYN